jgi:sterol desaturase/sphingolipid hydroxylase (fatty acid hydroxylase superfamily)
MLELLQKSLNAPVTIIYSMMYSLYALLIIGEASYGQIRNLGLYTWQDFAANMGMFAGFSLINAFWVHAVFWLYTWGGQFSVISLGSGTWHLFSYGGWREWLLLFVLDDLCYYCFHRSHHHLALLWPAHVPHHSSQQFNLSVALRQTWLPFTAVIFWLPLAWLGFDPLMIMTMQMISLFYQFFLHTRAVKPLGILEWVFNTPSHHSIHHACNEPYVNKNFGGVLIVWDRLFGSFAKQEGDVSVQYGIEPQLKTYNLGVIAFDGYKKLFRL